MKYCVVKDTIKVIDGSKNSKEAMLQNSINAGFLENEIEILTEKEYLARVKLGIDLTTNPSEKERINALENITLMIMEGIV